MENFSLDIHIHALLFKHNCVVIPGFGGFISNYKPAYYNAVNEVYFPPSRSLSFNKNLINNDGLLTQKIAEKYNISFEKANEFIIEAVAEYNHFLKVNNRLKLAKIGLLYFDNNNKIQFIPEVSENYQVDSFGLNPLYAPIIEEIKVAFNNEEVQEQISIENYISDNLEDKKLVKHPASSKSLFIKIASSAAAIALLVSGAFWVNQNTDKISNIDLSSFVPDKSLFLNNTDVELNYNKAFKIENSFNLLLNENALTNALTENKESVFKFNFSKGSVDSNEGLWVKTYKFEPKSKNGFYLVAGCFQEIENAEKLVKKLKQKGYNNAQIFDFENGLHRVSFGNNFATYQEAKNELLNIQKSNTGAWLVRK